MLKKAQEIARYAPPDLPDMEELDEMEDSERERLEDMIAAVSLARNPDQVKDEIEELKVLVEHAIRVEDAACEAKLSRLQELLKQQGFFDNPQQRLLIFTEFKDTLYSISAAIIEAVNLLGSDTDTIATMAGAIMGAATDVEPEGELIDRQYIKDEAIRLSEIGNGEVQKSFAYPDLMHWHPPKTMLDAVGYARESVAVAGLGYAHPIGDKWESRGKDSGVWQWLKLSFGQTILAKQRKNLPQLSETSLPQTKNAKGEKQMPKQENSTEQQVDLFDRNRVRRDKPTSARGIDELTNEAIKSGFKPEVIGKHILELAERANGIELALAYVAVTATMRMTARREAPPEMLAAGIRSRRFPSPGVGNNR
jgi:hypothetical protein